MLSFLFGAACGGALMFWALRRRVEQVPEWLQVRSALSNRGSRRADN